MDSENLKKLAFHINAAIKGHPLSNNITNPTYTHFYFDIFMNDAKKHKHGPFLTESFINGELMPLLEQNHADSEKEIDNFSKVWDAWVIFYREMHK